ncbi:MAG: ABC transporter ATP-binding protein [Halobacteriales archaeon]|nr:ABC transporter ATP-binding protein [Halobacteriales archaeon]
MDPVVAASGVRKAYGETTAIAGVDLEVGAGEVLGLIGPNGAGKTTLVRCLTGTTAPDAGEVSLFGEPPDRVDANRVGLLPQAFSPPDRLTARELVGYYAGLYDDARAVGTLLEEVGLAGAADTRYADLSGGQRRRTLVATALVNDPDVLFLDEPTTGIDPAGRRAVWGLVESLADGGTTVFLTTHSMAEAERLADRVGLLASGELVAIGRPRELVARHGGESRLVVETPAPEAALEALSYLEASRGDRGVFVDRLPAARVGEVVEALEGAEVPFDRLAWSEPDLERVYLELAGDDEGVSVRGRVGGVADA